MSFEIIGDFEKAIAEFFGAPHAVAVDCCTHGIELCLRYTGAERITVPKHTYLSIPFLANKLKIELEWSGDRWQDYYYLTDSVIDAAVLWRKCSYIPNTYMNISFQYKKHLSIGRGGIILCNKEIDYYNLKKMSYDGRLPNIPWREQDIESVGYHYYMTPESAKEGLRKLAEVIKKKPHQWVMEDWPDLTKMKVFKDNK